MRREKRVALKPKGNFRKHFRNDWMLYAMLLPVLLWYVIFCYLPMGASVWLLKITSTIRDCGTAHGSG